MKVRRRNNKFRSIGHSLRREKDGVAKTRSRTMRNPNAALDGRNEPRGFAS